MSTERVDPPGQVSFHLGFYRGPQSIPVTAVYRLTL